MDKLRDILHAAGELIAEQGFEATSVLDIAQRAGVAAGTIIYHFKSKHNLLFVLTRQITYNILSQARSAVAQAAGPKDELARLVNAYFAYASANRADILVIQKADPSLILDMSRFPNRDYAVMAEQYRGLYGDVLRRGMDDGSFAAASVDELASIIISLLYGLGRLTCYGTDIMRYREEVLRLIEKRLLVR
jgi:TetR/AcrR family fatty acid metabolism transcriptional regulator